MNAPPFQVCRPASAGPRIEKVLLYQGLYFRDRGLERLIESARHLKGGRIVFRGYGDWERHLQVLVKERGLGGSGVVRPSRGK